jgi:tetratricopeptide (TPR) repeat protein
VVVAQKPSGQARETQHSAPQALLAAAKEAHRAGRTAIAESFYAQVIRIAPAGAADAYRSLGILCSQTGRFPEAINHLNAALRLDPDDAALWNDLGTIYQGASRSQDAIEAYRKAVERRPDFAEAHYHLGTALHRLRHLVEAAESYRRAIALAPKAVEAHLNLGAALQELGNHVEAEVAFRRALAINPRSAPAHFNLGISLAALNRREAAIAAYRAVLKLEPNLAPAHLKLGMLLEEKRELDKAVACYRRAIALDPSQAMAFNCLGTALQGLGHAEEAIAAYREALRIDPTAVSAYFDLGVALTRRHQLDEALLCYRRAVALAPDLPAAHQELAMALRDRGQLDEAFAWYRRYAELVYGVPLSRPSAVPIKPYRTKHDREQLEHLTVNRRVPAAAALREELTREPASAERLHERFAPIFHIEGGERIRGPAVGPRSDAREIEMRWEHSKPNIVVIDDLLSATALQELRRFCWGSTIWRSEYQGGYLGAMPETGFAVPLLGQISTELVAAFPGVFRDYPLLQWWAFKYDSSSSGTGVHADFAAVNVNFWITPDEANLDQERGGLIIWNKPAPLDWKFEQYNGLDTAEIREFLASSGARAMTVPYRANRAVIFDSDLFHETDRISFKDGYLNRRINITLLYGLREDAPERPKPAKRRGPVPDEVNRRRGVLDR